MDYYAFDLRESGTPGIRGQDPDSQLRHLIPLRAALYKGDASQLYRECRNSTIPRTLYTQQLMSAPIPKTMKAVVEAEEVGR